MQRLAAGGMGEVYRAELVSGAGITKPVVIKKILPELARDERFKQMFLEEARIAAGLTHANIAQVIDVDEIDGEPYLALEFVSGRSFADLLRRVSRQGVHLPEAYGCLIVEQMCRGLHHAHTRVDAQKRPLQIVHRDATPQNVMLSFDGEVKVVDFGIARAYGDDRPGRVKTATGLIKGKFRYFSPEQVHEKPVDARTDVYAAGICLYEAVTGRRPFRGQMAEVMRSIAFGEFAHPRVVAPEVSEGCERLILKAMAPLEERFATARDFADALAWHIANIAPGFGPSALGAVMRLTFEEDLLRDGEAPAIPEELRTAARSWPRVDTEPGSSDDGLRSPPPRSSAPGEGERHLVTGPAPEQAPLAPTVSSPPAAAPRARRWPWIAASGAVVALAAGLGWMFFRNEQPEPAAAALIAQSTAPLPVARPAGTPVSAAKAAESPPGAVERPHASAAEVALTVREALARLKSQKDPIGAEKILQTVKLEGESRPDYQDAMKLVSDELYNYGIVHQPRGKYGNVRDCLELKLIPDSSIFKADALDILKRHKAECDPLLPPQQDHRVASNNASPKVGAVGAASGSHKGMTWGVRTDVAVQHDLVFVGCSGVPQAETATGACNPYQGDTLCSVDLPVLCVHAEGGPTPKVLQAPQVAGEISSKAYGSWSGLRAQVSTPTPGNAFRTRAEVDAFCASTLGRGWRTAEFHAGGGWSFYAYGSAPTGTRFWVAIDDQDANCWAK